MLEKLKQIEGLQTVDTVQEKLHLSRQSAINLLSKLKKMQHVTVMGGGRQPRIYRITVRKQRPRHPGMFDMINKYSPMKLSPWYDHQVHGKYTVEDAIVDAITTKSFRAILASLCLYPHIRDWKRLYERAKKHDVWQEVGAMHDVARTLFRTPRLPKKYQNIRIKSWKTMTRLKNRKNFPEIEDKWKVHIPFNQKDLYSIR